MAAVEEEKLPVDMGKMMVIGEQMSLFAIQGLKLSGVNRDSSGVNLADFEGRFGQKISQAFPHVPLLESLGLVGRVNNHLRLTYQGLCFEQPVLKSFYHR